MMVIIIFGPGKYLSGCLCRRDLFTLRAFITADVTINQDFFSIYLHFFIALLNAFNWNLIKILLAFISDFIGI